MQSTQRLDAPPHQPPRAPLSNSPILSKNPRPVPLHAAWPRSPHEAGAPIYRTMADALKQCTAIVKDFLEMPDADPFRDPVDWKAWGLYDYPKLIKRPMDMTTVLGKLDAGEYTSPNEFAKDMRQIWKNCQIYNQDGSEFHQLSLEFSRRFEEEFLKVKQAAGGVSDDEGERPTIAEKTLFSQNIYKIDSVQLGRVVELLDEKCESAIDKTNPSEIEINIDAIDASTFDGLDRYVRDCLGESKKGKKRKADGSGSSKKKKPSGR